MAAIFMVGDGLVGLAQPHRHVAMWRDSRFAGGTLVRAFVGRPRLRQAYGAVQIAAGLWLASRQRP